MSTRAVAVLILVLGGGGCRSSQVESSGARRSGDAVADGGSRATLPEPFPGLFDASTGKPLRRSSGELVHAEVRKRADQLIACDVPADLNVIVSPDGGVAWSMGRKHAKIPSCWAKALAGIRAEPDADAGTFEESLPTDECGLKRSPIQYCYSDRFRRQQLEELKAVTTANRAKLIACGAKDTRVSVTISLSGSVTWQLPIGTPECVKSILTYNVVGDELRHPVGSGLSYDFGAETRPTDDVRAADPKYTLSLLSCPPSYYEGPEH